MLLNKHNYVNYDCKSCSNSNNRHESRRYIAKRNTNISIVQDYKKYKYFRKKYGKNNSFDSLSLMS